jgi:hypothetical protein
MAEICKWTAECAKRLALFLHYLGYSNIQLVLLNNTNSTVCAVQRETEFHTAVLDRSGAFGILCILQDIIEMELKM